MAEKVSFKNSKGLNLVGDFYKGSNGKCIILCHGFCSNKDRKRIIKAAEIYNEQGFAFLIEPDGMGSFQYFDVCAPCTPSWNAKKLAEYDETVWENLYKAQLRFQKFLSAKKNLIYTDSIPMFFVDA